MGSVGNAHDQVTEVAARDRPTTDAGTAPEHDLVDLHGLAGNRAVALALGSAPPPPAEGRTAASVHGPLDAIGQHRAPRALIARAAARIDAVAGPVAPEVATRIERARPAGGPLDTSIRQQMETGFGTSFADVRLHTGPEADDLSRSLQARAFTTGTDIFLRTDAPSPPSTAGRHLLAHELAHVVQQRTGPAHNGPLAVGRSDDPAEAQADRAADEAVGLADQAPLVPGSDALAGTSTAGEGAVATSAIRRSPGGTSTDAGQPPDADDKWKEAGGDTMVTTIQSDLASWADYKKRPTTMDDMPGKAALEAISTFNKQVALMGTWVKPYASKKLGSGPLRELGNMLSMKGYHGRDDVSALFNVELKDPGHKYELKSKEAADLTETALITIMQLVEISYSNALGMTWTGSYYLPGGSAALRLESASQSKGLDAELGKGVGIQPEFNPSVDIGPATFEARLNLTFAGAATATPGHLGFYGPDDLDLSPVTILNGPSGEFAAIEGYKRGSGILIQFRGRSVPLDFETSHFELAASGAGAVESNDKVVPRIKFDFGGMGVGLALGGIDRDAQNQEYEPPVVPARKQWPPARVRFATGSAEAEDLSAIDSLLQQVRQTLIDERVLADAEYLRERGVDQGTAAALQITVEGFASQLWTAAGDSEDARLTENDALSRQRAEAVGAYVAGRLAADPGDLTITTVGRGVTSVVMDWANTGMTERSSENRDQLITADVKAVNADFDSRIATVKASYANEEMISEADRQRRTEQLAALESQRNAELDKVRQPAADDRKDNDPMARSAKVTITWEGQRVGHELPAVPKAPAAPPSGP